MMFRKFLGLVSLALVLTQASAFAMAKAPAKDDPSVPKVDPRQAISQLILQYNQKYADVSGLISWDANLQKSELAFANSRATVGLSELCQEAASFIPDGTTCSQLVQYAFPNQRELLHCTPFSCTEYRDYHVTITFSLSPESNAILGRAFYFDSSQTAVDYNVHAISSALRKLKLLPSQKKALEGFWNATDNFSSAIDAEKAKAAAGQPAKPLTHRDFVAQASLVVAYYRYLKQDFAELAQFGSVEDGIDQTNATAVNVINEAITNIVSAYGLDADVMQKQAADYGRVFVDRANTFAQNLTENEKQTYIRPLLLLLGSKIIPVSESYGDVSIHDAVMEFKAQWEDPSFQKFLQDKLSASDDRTSTLILNLSNLAYKIGQAANVRIDAIDPNSIQK